MKISECKDCEWYKKDVDTGQHLCKRYLVEIHSVPNCVVKVPVKKEK